MAAESSKPRLIYFDMKGRAEPIRLAFAIGGIDFEDVRISRESFQANKDSYPFGQLPVMEIGGQTIAQSQALLRYAGMRAGLYPADDAMQALLADEAVGGVEDVISAMLPSLKEQDEEKKIKMRDELASTTLPKWFGMIEKKLQETDPEGTGYCVGGKLSIVDLFMYSIFSWMTSGILDGIPTTILDGFPKIQAVLAKVEEHPKVKEWNAKHNPPK